MGQALHSHGKGQKHYATLDSDTVLEIYPASEKFPVSVSTRIGFEVDSCEQVTSSLLASGYTALTMPTESPWGMRAVFVDPDDHRVELISV